jgi:hypothetical protein
MEYREYWNQIYEKSDELNSLIASYWNDYSHMGTWQFWFVAFLMIAPLVLLYFTVDRTRIFEVFFFGYTVHILWIYADLVLERYGFFVHTYFLSPYFPFASNITASLLPGGYLLVYQYCTNKNKNFYLYAFLFAVVITYTIAPLEEILGLVEIRKGMSKFYVVVIGMGAASIAYLFTRFIIRLSKKSP